MAITRVQTVARAVTHGFGLVTFPRRTVAGRLLVVVAVAKGGAARLLNLSGMTLVGEVSGGGRTTGIRAAVWYRQNAPATTSLTVLSTGSSDGRALVVRAYEYAGAAQSNALDRFRFTGSEDNADSDTPDSGVTQATSQADELVVGFIANRNASTTQGSYLGEMTPLFTDVSPPETDNDRVRLTTFERLTATTGAQFLSGRLTTPRDWAAGVASFRAGTTGAVSLRSTAQPAVTVSGGPATLTNFGKLRSTAQPAVTVSGGPSELSPSYYQYRLNGLTIGQGTPYRVIGYTGLDGYDVRDSDEDQPREDGAIPGLDLQAARRIGFRIRVEHDPATAGQPYGRQTSVRQRLDALIRALTPQRDEPWDLVWRWPGTPVLMVRARPRGFPRDAAPMDALLGEADITLAAADPRIYSRRLYRLEVPLSTAATPVTVTAGNAGNKPANPVVTFTGSPSAQTCTGVTLFNETANVGLDIRTLLLTKQLLVADMEARVTRAPRSVITLDGDSRYGQWQLPRAAFQLLPGDNVLRFTTVDATDVTCVLTWRDTWAG